MNFEVKLNFVKNLHLYNLSNYINLVKMCSDSQSHSEIPSNLLVNVIKIVKM